MAKNMSLKKQPSLFLQNVSDAAFLSSFQPLIISHFFTNADTFADFVSSGQSNKKLRQSHSAKIS
jgi:hypothetical protein